MVRTIRVLIGGTPRHAIGFAHPSYYSFVTDGMDGQARSEADAGADEYSTGGVLRRPLTSLDVGPNAP